MQETADNSGMYVTPALGHKPPFLVILAQRRLLGGKRTKLHNDSYFRQRIFHSHQMRSTTILILQCRLSAD